MEHANTVSDALAELMNIEAERTQAEITAENARQAALAQAEKSEHEALKAKQEKASEQRRLADVAVRAEAIAKIEVAERAAVAKAETAAYQRAEQKHQAELVVLRERAAAMQAERERLEQGKRGGSVGLRVMMGVVGLAAVVGFGAVGADLYKTMNAPTIAPEIVVVHTPAPAAQPSPVAPEPILAAAPVEAPIEVVAPVATKAKVRGRGGRGRGRGGRGRGGQTMRDTSSMGLAGLNNCPPNDPLCGIPL